MVEGKKIGDKYAGKFDRVLLDAPCSGEGRFIITNPMTYKNWSDKKVSDLVKMQKKLLTSAYKALKIGGVLVYSTCTINRDENEFVLDWAIKNFDIKLQRIEIDIKNSISGFNEGLDNSINKSLKILPSKIMEGFFISKFIKIS